MTDWTDSEQLKAQQYNNSVNLGARIHLHTLYSVEEIDLHHRLFNYLLEDLPQSANILEVGCGRGDFWKNNMPRIPENWTITLTDFSDGMLADARTNLGDQARRFNFEVMNVQAIPYAENEFDAVLAYFMLYHVPDREQAFQQVRQVLKPEGKFYAVTLGNVHMHQFRHLVKRIFETHDSFDNSTLPFKRENGVAQLQTAFRQIETIDIVSHMEVTEVEPLIDYVKSMRSLMSMTDKQEAQFREQAQREIDANGYFRIDRQVALFIAQR